MLLFLISTVIALQFNEETASKIFNEGKPALILFHDETIEEFSKLESNNILIIEASLQYIATQKLSKLLNINQFPTIKLIVSKGPNFSDIQTISYDDSITQEKLNKFIQRYQDGQLFYDIQSEDIPSQTNEDGIQLVVGHNYEERVQDTSRHYLIYFYSKECDLCQSMLNNLIKLNNQVRTGKTSFKPNLLKIGKINGELNKINGLKINKYPTLLLYLQNNKEPLEYRGDRTTEGMLMWLESVNK